MSPDRLPRLAFGAAAVFLVFLLGFASAHFRFFPYGPLARALNQGAALVERTTQVHELRPARHDFAGVRAYDAGGPVDPAAIQPKPGEVVLLSSYWPELDWRPGLRAIDRTGRILHSWDTKEAMGAWPGRTSLLDRFAGFTYVHGSHLFQNGDVLMNVEYLGLVRMNAAGQVIWKLDRRTHHSIHPSDDGNFWVCESRMIDSADEVARRFRGLPSPLVEDRALLVSPDGKVVEEISILEMLYGSEHRNRILSYPVGPSRNPDILHLNDVEPLPAAIAAEYPTFSAGDLLVSMRDVSLVVVFDPKSGKIKWSLEGPVLRQHDPDFAGGGWISVFDNNSDETAAGESLGGSRLVAFRPETGERRRIYPPEGPGSGHERPFYSLVGGKAQRLPDGHWLITEATAARVFEIDAGGRTVWEWAHERHGPKGMVSEVMEGTRYDLDPDAVRKWSHP